MKFTKLRCVGFKSFVEPTEFLIENGLTGVVGPNGCGKSNLVEALRWAMGESSYKNMRASGMDDVIFSGSGNRPSRNTAEVSLFLDNRDRSAPAAFNDSDELQISRRIEREAGSVYRINGRDARAKDVQLLFADASTGARSPSMVGQGRIGELISAKPQARRALLEEAAGISGLHSRRHEAELRLRAADQNLERLEDVLAQLDSQIDNLKRQARQANRYRNISAEIRRMEALVLHLKWSDAKSGEDEAHRQLTASVSAVGEKAQVQAAAARRQAETAGDLPRLRELETQAAAGLQRLTLARDQIAEEIRRLAERKSELEKRNSQLDEDLEREGRIVSENAEYIERLENEKEKLLVGSQEQETRAGELRNLLELAAAKLAEHEKAYAELTDETAAARARRGETERLLAQSEKRVLAAQEQLSAIETELGVLNEKLGAEDGPARSREQVVITEQQARDAESRAGEMEKKHEAARLAERELREPLGDAGSKLDRIEAEIATLKRILDIGAPDMFAAVIEKMTVEPGFETALGAALGADLDLPLDNGAPARWTLIDGSEDDPALPHGVRQMSDVVKAPAELARRLAQTGIVNAEDGPRLAAGLAPGQLLVSLEGDLWRWDGYVANADAPTAAAQKFAQKNRLAELETERIEAAKIRDDAAQTLSAAQQAASELQECERTAREAWRKAGRDLAEARDKLIAAERAVADLASRRDKLVDAQERTANEKVAAETAIGSASATLEELPDIADLDARLEKSRMALAEKRAALAEIRAESDAYTREMNSRRARSEEIVRELAKWRERAENARAQITKLETRHRETAEELAKIADAPEAAEQRRSALVEQIEQAEGKRRTAADALATCENNLAEADRNVKQADIQLAEAREAKIRAEERQTSAQERTSEIAVRIREELECEPVEAIARAELKPEAALPDLAGTESRLDKLKAERERLGAVNLRAEAEQNEIVERRDALIAERDDLIEAIKRLRSGISSLNKEGRERLLAAFDVVNEHFSRLFTHLFGGGKAELQLVESDDPLEAGLEILARPPGKRPQTMTLLSGGEQALAAMALIFAVFLTNPAPICVLDEVDAPLDDHNVERFCNLMDEMVASTQTRFLIITHNPITMARMNRLFGVTMAERGVSEIVSVDLEEAERLREAG